MTDSTQLTLIDCLRKSGELRRQADAKHAAYSEEHPNRPDQVGIESGQPLADEDMKPSLDWATLVAREPQLAGIREHRQQHPTASESARARWEGEQKRLHGCDYIDVNGERVCAVHGPAPMISRANRPGVQPVSR